MARAVDLLAIVEASYAIERPEGPWLAGLARAVLEHGALSTLGAYAQSYSLSAGGVLSFGDIQFAGDSTDRLRALHDELGAYYMTRPDRVLATYGETDEGFALALPGGERSRIQSILARWRVADMYGINARSPSGRGCLLCVYLPPGHRAISNERRIAFARIARHVSTAVRLRHRLAAREGAAPEAIFDANGVLRHAVGAAKRGEARQALQAAASKLRRLRGAHRSTTPERDVAAWKALVEARWSLVDHFEHDGNFYMVAHRNDAAAAPIRLLTERERQVVALAAMGLANKMIAYELGIATSTVGVLVARAVARVGARSRKDLIATYLATTRSADTSQT
jgi:DNA-binding CsgD family transcriptional regulator